MKPTAARGTPTFQTGASAGCPPAENHTRPGAPPPALTPTALAPDRHWLWIASILLVAGVWRAVVAFHLPALSRDGVTFCWYARALGEQGAAYLRTPAAQQHPLYPLLILGAQRTARACGAPDSPWTWQRSGQAVAWLAGLAVVALTGALTARLARQLELPIDRRSAVLLAMGMATLLDVNVWLSADVMSDQVHIAFYLAAVLMLVNLDSWRVALGCGLCAGLAFLTRQEGFLPVAAGLLTVAAWARTASATAARATRGQLATRALALLAGFLLLAAPYWMTVGRFSTKKDPLDVLRQPVARTADAAPRQTAGTLTNSVTLVPRALYKVLRAGRVVIPLLAVLPLLSLRGRLWRRELAGWSTCLVGHFILGTLLLGRYGYLDPRHVLIVVMLLLPLAAMQLSRAVSLLCELHRPGRAAALAALLLLPLALYSLRLPNAKEGFLVDAARWLVAHDPGIKTKRLLCASSPRRTAFYADMQWDVWYDDFLDYADLARRLKSGPPGYFAIEVVTTGDERKSSETTGNRDIVNRLTNDPEVTPHLRQVHAVPSLRGTELLLFELRPANGTSTTGSGRAAPPSRPA